jgi:formylglycine-generating enzyme required for sulfatase activity
MFAVVVVLSALVQPVRGAQDGADAVRHTQDGFDALKRQFDYDASQPLNVEQVLLHEREGVKVYDVSYVSPKGGRVTAYLVVPTTQGRHAGLLFGHWGAGDRTEFLPEATLCARAGAVSLLIDYPWVRPAKWRKKLKEVADPESDYQTRVQTVIELRRGIDLLAARTDVDPNRLAYIGHSFGAQWGAILSAVDGRLKGAILMGGVPDQAAIWRDADDPDIVEVRKALPQGRLEAYLKSSQRTDPVFYVDHTTIPLFFQFARYERYFNKAAMDRYANAATCPKEVRWYDTGHDLNDPQALADRAAWLKRIVGLADRSSAPPSQAEAAKYPGQVRNDNGLETKFVWVPPGQFEMGSPPEEPRRYENENQVMVILTKGFWLGQHEVTQGEWKRVMRSMPWSGMKNIEEGDNYAATHVNWHDARAFCEKLTQSEHEAGRLATGWVYTLPTEAQWEYACRAGKTSYFSFGDDPSVLSRYAWWGGLVERGSAAGAHYAHPVAQKAPNEWGLYDMHGNVWEWCRDKYGDHLSAGPDPEGPKEGPYRVYRGGGWSDSAGYCRTARRSGDEPGSRLDNLGFRIALVEK